MPGQAADLSGVRFGRLVVTARDGSDARGNAKWACRCDCGQSSLVLAQSLKSGATSSCGCLAREVAGQVNKKHGASSTAPYKAWHAMLQRCENPQHHKWHRYGGRGITVCERWHSYENFLSDMGPRPDGMSIERENNNGNYEPGNCSWATPIEQASNRSTNLFVDASGQRATASAASRLLGSNRSTVARRMRSGWTEQQAVNTPIGIRKENA